MSNVEWKRMRHLKNPNCISLVERYNDIRLSDCLKELITSYNGGYPKPNSIKLPNGQEYDVKTLLSYNDDDQDSIFKVMPFFCKHYHGDLIPFAKDSADNYYCEQKGKIVIWMQEDGEIIPVCDSLAQFIDRLEPI